MVKHASRLKELADGSEGRRPIISVANHISCVDDPLVWGPRFWEPVLVKRGMRWVLAADNICFTNRLSTWFFSLGQGIPIHRGSGVHQEGIRFATRILDKGGWVHVFPEGKVHQDGKLHPFKWGKRCICAHI